MAFPSRIRELLTDWRAGSVSAENDNKTMPALADSVVLQGRLVNGGLPVKLYFDRGSGLLLRLVRFSNTVIGTVPVQIDYSDYRDVAGLKFPFQWIVTWTDGRSTIQLSELRANVPIEATRFAKPASETKSGRP